MRIYVTFKERIRGERKSCWVEWFLGWLFYRMAVLSDGCLIAWFAIDVVRSHFTTGVQRLLHQLDSRHANETPFDKQRETRHGMRRVVWTWCELSKDLCLNPTDTQVLSLETTDTLRITAKEQKSKNVRRTHFCPIVPSEKAAVIIRNPRLALDINVEPSSNVILLAHPTQNTVVAQENVKNT